MASGCGRHRPGGLLLAARLGGRRRPAGAVAHHRWLAGGAGADCPAPRLIRRPTAGCRALLRPAARPLLEALPDALLRLRAPDRRPGPDGGEGAAPALDRP